MKHETIFSPCRKYRYTLWRYWPDMFIGETSSETQAHRYVQFIGLNPSTADETQDDPTIRRCIGFAKAWGYGAICMTNLFAFRATQPEDMKRAQNPAGEENKHFLLQCAAEAGLIVAAWGKDGAYGAQDLTVQQWLTKAGFKLHYLKLNLDGSPRHPLYISAATEPTLWKI